MFESSVPDESDADRIATIHVAAMQSNILLPAQFPTQQSLGSLREFLRKDTLIHLRNHSKQVLVARDIESQKIVGFVKWELPSNMPKPEEDELDWPEDCCRKYIDEYYELAEAAGKSATGDNHCVHPAWQGRGVASLLISEVLGAAKSHQWPVYLESTLEAVEMYKRLGFEAVGGFKMEVPKFDSPDGTATYKEICLLWDENRKRTKHHCNDGLRTIKKAALSSYVMDDDEVLRRLPIPSWAGSFDTPTPDAQ